MDPFSGFYSFAALPHDELVRRLPMAGLLAHGDLAPFRLRLAANWRLTLTTTVGMVAWIHDRAAHRGPEAHVAGCAGPSDAPRAELKVSDLPGPRHPIVVVQVGHILRQSDPVASNF